MSGYQVVTIPLHVILGMGEFDHMSLLFQLRHIKGSQAQAKCVGVSGHRLIKPATAYPDMGKFDAAAAEYLFGGGFNYRISLL
jgi:hypothetical protein